MQKNPIISRLAIVFLALVFFGTFFTFRNWEKERFIDGDGFSYYVYLPALFIKGDLQLTFMDQEKDSYFHHLWFSRADNGIRFTKMGCGVAVMQFPFFLGAHALAKPFGFKDDGFSLPYRFALSLATVFYSIFSIVFLRRILNRFFSDKVTALVLVSVTLGTSLLHYGAVEGLMSHAYSFFLFVLVLKVTISFYENPGYGNAISLGLVMTGIVLVRPSNGLTWLIPLVWGINSFGDIKSRFSFLKKHVLKISAGLFFGFVFLGIQLAYWKISTGHWVYYSYRHEKFYLFQAHVLEGLIGFRKGWLIYAPVMVFSLAGFYFLRRYAKEGRFALMIFFPLNCWLVFSWWCWWYGGSFGMRALVEAQAFLTLPMGAFYTFIFEKPLWVRRISLSFVSMLIGLTLFQTYQYQLGILHYDGMNWTTYKKIFFQTRFPEGYDESIVHPDYDSAIVGKKEKH